MSLFGLIKCSHPFDKLIVENNESKVDGEFVKHSIKFQCMGCRSVVEKKFASFLGGVDEFLKRDPK